MEDEISETDSSLPFGCNKRKLIPQQLETQAEASYICTPRKIPKLSPVDKSEPFLPYKERPITQFTKQRQVLIKSVSSLEHYVFTGFPDEACLSRSCPRPSPTSDRYASSGSRTHLTERLIVRISWRYASSGNPDDQSLRKIDRISWRLYIPLWAGSRGQLLRRTGTHRQKILSISFSVRSI